MSEMFKKSMLDSPLWGRGFRPFFMLGAAYTIISILVWVSFYSGSTKPPSVFSDPVTWHAHEMLYGFVMAIVSGFLLTAVANWTGGAPVRQIHLMLLCLFWIIGRLAMNIEGLPRWMMFAGELSFIPALTVSLSLPLLKSWNARNFIFLGLLTIMWCCDIAFLFTQARTPLYIAIFIILMMISLIGGRIIPAFTVGALRRAGVEIRIHDQPLMNKMALLSIILVAGSLLMDGANSHLFGSACFISASVHLYRMRFYHTVLTFRYPLLWVLHAGYGWMIAGLVLAGLSTFSIVAFPASLHALTVGVIGSMTIGMMCRVSLGHTGRELVSGFLTTLSFCLMQLAALLRVAGPIAFPDNYKLWIISSGILWSTCFLLYLIVYAPMLWQPRPDRQPA